MFLARQSCINVDIRRFSPNPNRLWHYFQSIRKKGRLIFSTFNFDCRLVDAMVVRKRCKFLFDWLLLLIVDFKVESAPRVISIIHLWIENHFHFIWLDEICDVSFHSEAFPRPRFPCCHFVNYIFWIRKIPINILNVDMAKTHVLWPAVSNRIVHWSRKTDTHCKRSPVKS